MPNAATIVYTFNIKGHVQDSWT